MSSKERKRLNARTVREEREAGFSLDDLVTRKAVSSPAKSLTTFDVHPWVASDPGKPTIRYRNRSNRNWGV